MLPTKGVRVFYAYAEDWEDVQFSRTGDNIYAAKVSVKYEWLKYIEAYKDDHIGTFRELDCAILTKCLNGSKSGMTSTGSQKKGPGLGYFYSILGIYDSYDPELKLEYHVESVYDTWERYWDMYIMVVDYYKKYPDPYIRIITHGDNNGGGTVKPDKGGKSDERSSEGKE